MTFQSEVTSKGQQTTGILSGKLRIEEQTGRMLVYDETGIPRVLIGVAPDGSVGLWVSKPGENVLTIFT